MKIILVKNGVVENIIEADSLDNDACEGFDHKEECTGACIGVNIGATYNGPGDYTNPEPEEEE